MEVLREALIGGRIIDAAGASDQSKQWLRHAAG